MPLALGLAAVALVCAAALALTGVLATNSNLRGLCWLGAGALILAGLGPLIS